MPTPIKVAVTISEVIEHAPGLRSFILKPERYIPTFVPGQFLHLAIDPYSPGAHWPDSRVFSIASSPTERQKLRVTISRQGRFTSRMFDELTVGSKAWVKLPYGTFCPSADVSTRLVLFAGGSGITPYVSFLEWAVAAQPSATIELHYGARDAQLLIYRPQIEQCRAAGLRGLRAHYYVEEAPLDGVDDPSLVVGRLSTRHVWNGLAAPQNCRFYLSGPRAMIDTFRGQLLALGAPAEAVLSDDWS